MRARLHAFMESLGWVGLAAVVWLLLAVGVVAGVVHLARVDDPAQYGLPTPTVLERLPSGVPRDFPLAVSVPPSGRVVEGVVYAEGQTHMIVEAAGTAAELLRFYERYLAEQGWRRVPWASPASAGGEQAMGIFCNPTGGPVVGVLAGRHLREAALGNKLTVTISVHHTVWTSCSPDMQPPPEYARPLPPSGVGPAVAQKSP